MNFICPKKKLKGETLVKRYDLIKPTRCLMEEYGRYLRISHDDCEAYTAYFTISDVVGELDFRRPRFSIISSSNSRSPSIPA